jgi:hypothetical protein
MMADDYIADVVTKKSVAGRIMGGQESRYVCTVTMLKQVGFITRVEMSWCNWAFTATLWLCSIRSKQLE